jgi:hypothetical protein
VTPPSAGRYRATSPGSPPSRKQGRPSPRLNRDGRLERGLRAVLAHHLIFHFNRAGISSTDQATMAALAVSVVFHAEAEGESPGFWVGAAGISLALADHSALAAPATPTAWTAALLMPPVTCPFQSRPDAMTEGRFP